MPSGGYVPENGISLCHPCHVKADRAELHYTENDLFEKISSSEETARKASEKLG